MLITSQAAMYADSACPNDNCGATPAVQRVGQMKWKYANFKHKPKQHSNNMNI
jgi:hypothetical protein